MKIRDFRWGSEPFTADTRRSLADINIALRQLAGDMERRVWGRGDVTQQPFNPGSFTVRDGYGAVVADHLTLEGSEVMTLEGDAVLRIV